MPKTARPQPTRVDLKRHLGAEGETEYQQLVAMLRETQGRFALMPVRSDFPTPVRDALFTRLVKDLRPSPVSIVPLGWSSSWDAMRLISEAAAKLPKAGVVVLTGLEMTPGITPAPGEEDERPPTLAVLNHGREALKIHCPHPLILWADGATFRALADHAPDFLDHFTGLFRFDDASPVVQEASPSRLETAFPQRPDETDRSGWAAALAFYEEQVRIHHKPSLERARALAGLGDALRYVPDARPASRMSRAEELLRESLGMIPFDEHPEDWANAQGILGGILSSKPIGNREANLTEAIACYRAALRIYTEVKFPEQWAMTQNNLGIVYRKLPTGDRGANLTEVFSCHHAALRIYTEVKFPDQWAMTQNHLGGAYWALPTGDRGANLLEAIACYRAALRVYTEVEFPEQWAMTQNNLGNAYRGLPTGDRGVNLSEAIACYRAALRVQTEVDFPAQWAMTQNNLGNAYGVLPTGDRGANLLEAIACYRAALRVETEVEFSDGWATTQYNLGITLTELGKISEARVAFTSSAQCFRAVGRDDGVQVVEWALASIRDIQPQSSPPPEKSP